MRDRYAVWLQGNGRLARPFDLGTGGLGYRHHGRHSGLSVFPDQGTEAVHPASSPEVGSDGMNNVIGLLILAFVVDEILSEATGLEPTWQWILRG